MVKIEATSGKHFTKMNLDLRLSSKQRARRKSLMTQNLKEHFCFDAPYSFLSTSGPQAALK